MPKSLVPAGVLGALLLLSSLPADAAAPPGSPEEVVERIAAAAQNGDVQSALGFFEPSSRRTLAEVEASGTALRQGMEAFRAALDEQFGPAAQFLEPTAATLEAALAEFQGAEVLGREAGPQGTVLRLRLMPAADDDEAPAREASVLLRQGKDGWRVVLGQGPDGGRTEERLAALDDVVAAVRRGEYATPQAAMVALAERWSAGEGRVP